MAFRWRPDDCLLVVVCGSLHQLQKKHCQCWTRLTKTFWIRACYKASFCTGSHLKISKGVKIRNRYNQVPHLTQDTNGKVTKSQPDTTKEVNPFPAGDHKAHTNRHTHKGIANTRQKNIKDQQKKYRLGTVSKIFDWRA